MTEEKLVPFASSDAKSETSNLGALLATHLSATVVVVATAIAELLASIDPQYARGLPTGVLSFIMKLGLAYSSERELSILRRTVQDLQSEIRVLRERGALIDFTVPTNLESLFYKIEDCVKAQNDQKLDLLRRVARNGLIQHGFDLAEERGFRFAVSMLEAEDVAALLEIRTIIDKPRTVVRPRVVKPIDRPAGYAFPVELANFPPVTLARLGASGLLLRRGAYGGDVYELTRSTKRFLGYLGVQSE